MEHQKHKVQWFLGLRAKALLFSFVIMAALTGMCAVYLSSYHRQLLSREAGERMDTIGRAFAYQSEYGTLTSDEKHLDKVIDGILMEKDILAALVMDLQGNLLSGRMKDEEQRSLGYLLDSSFQRSLAGNLAATESIAPWGDVNVRAYPIHTTPESNSAELDFFSSQSESVKDIGYAVMVFSPKRILAEVARGQAEVFRVILIFMLGVLSLVGILSTFFVKQLKRLLVATQKMGEGGMPEAITIRTADELAQLAESFNRMIHNLKDTTVSRDALAREVLERKKIEKEVLHAKQQAETANRMKSEFLASMSHEIRTPMNAILGMSDILWSENLPDAQRDYVRIIRSAGTSLLNLINDILDFSKVEAGHLELEKVDFEIRDLCEKTMEMMALRAHEKGLELICQIAPEAAIVVHGDPYRVRQILTNLVGNAIKFTEKGEVSLLVEALSAPSGKVHLQFTIKDTGIGIASDKMNTIFDSFTQGDASTTRKYGGTGLGLAICRKLVQLMDGEIRAKSLLGVGTSIVFDLYFVGSPGGEGAVFKKDVVFSQDLRGRKALVIDDNETNRRILRHTLSSWGMDVDEAERGEVGLEILRHRRTARKEDYDFILLDRCMPHLDGFEVVEAIKKEFAVSGILMMLTSDKRAGDVARSRELGITSCLVKPVQQSALYLALLEAIQQSRSLAPRAESLRDVPTTSVVDKSGARILLVEDNENNRLVIQLYLKELPYRIDNAEDGARGFAMFEKGRYDLVLMDLQMPVMDGYEATRRIRTLEKEKGLQRTPVIALTANAFREETKAILAAGCDQHLVKPIARETLLAALQQYLGKGNA